MPVYINNQQWLGAEDILEWLKKKGEVINRIQVDGEEYTGPPEQILNEAGREIKIETINIDQLIVETQDSIKTYIPKLKEGISRVANLLQRGQENDACTMATSIIDGFAWLIHAVGAINALRPGYLPEAEIIAFKEISAGLLEAWRNKDFVLVSDFFEYELLPLIDRWGEILGSEDHLP